MARQPPGAAVVSRVRSDAVVLGRTTSPGVGQCPQVAFVPFGCCGCDYADLAKTVGSFGPLTWGRSQVGRTRAGVSTTAYMNSPAATGYSHTQRGPLCLILYTSALACVVLAAVLDDTAGIYIAFVIGLALALIAPAFHHLTVEYRGDRLLIRFGPLPLLKRTVAYADIEWVEVGRTWLIEGWGVHYGPRGGRVWNLWGRECVVVHSRRGTLRIGTDDPEGLVAFLKTKDWRTGTSTMTGGNIFTDLPSPMPEEVFTMVTEAAGVRVERIASLGHLTRRVLVRPGATRVGHRAAGLGQAPVRGRGAVDRDEGRGLGEHPGPPAALGRVDDAGRTDRVAGRALRARDVIDRSRRCGRALSAGRSRSSGR